MFSVISESWAVFDLNTRRVWCVVIPALSRNKKGERALWPFFSRLVWFISILEFSEMFLLSGGVRACVPFDGVFPLFSAQFCLF